MDQNLRASIQTSTFYYFMIVTTLTTISQLTTMSVIVFADISGKENVVAASVICLLYTSPSPRDRSVSRMPSSA